MTNSLLYLSFQIIILIMSNKIMQRSNSEWFLNLHTVHIWPLDWIYISKIQYILRDKPKQKYILYLNSSGSALQKEWDIFWQKTKKKFICHRLFLKKLLFSKGVGDEFSEKNIYKWGVPGVKKIISLFRIF